MHEITWTKTPSKQPFPVYAPEGEALVVDLFLRDRQDFALYNDPRTRPRTLRIHLDPKHGDAYVFPKRQQVVLMGAFPLVHPVFTAMLERLLLYSEDEFADYEARDVHGDLLGNVGPLVERQHVQSVRVPRRAAFSFSAIQSLADIELYHATPRSNWASIAARGLTPRSDSGGWSSEWNMDKQVATYLTASLDYAYRIAETLAARKGEEALVLAVPGRALNTAKVVADEDMFIAGEQPAVPMAGVPSFLTALQDRRASIACYCRIDMRHISQVGLVSPDDAEEDATA